MLRQLPLEQEIARRKAEAERKRISRDADIIRENCRKLRGFIKEGWAVLEPTTRYIDNWHIGAISEHLEAISNKQITRLQINEPPGCMKSLVASVMWQAWEWGPRDLPGLRYLTTSYTETYARRDSRKSRDLILSEWYQALWPQVKLVRDNETDFENTMKGARRAMPFASLTAGRGNRVIIDDPHSTEGVESETDRNKAVRIFRESVTSRLNDPITDAIMVIMHRLHNNDVCGEIERLGLDYVKLVLPMEYDPKTVIVTKYFTDPRRAYGELLCPERLPREIIDQNKIELGSHAYACQYQQTPSSRQGGMFKRHWFPIIDAMPVTVKRRVRKWDLAASLQLPGTDPDWSVGVKLAELEDGSFVVEDVVRFRELGASVRAAIKRMAASDTRACHIVVPQDPGQAGKDQAQSIIKENVGYIIKAIRETGSKDVRAEPFAAQCEAQNVKILRGPWNEEFINELCAFPQGHDDQVDAAAGAFNYFVVKRLPSIPDSLVEAIQNMPRRQR